MQEEKLSDVWVLALFKRLQARYLHKWTSGIEGIEKDAMIEWGQVLAGLNGGQIKHGLETWDSDWPPSAIEFKNACLGKRSGPNEYGLDYVPEYYRTRTLDKSRLLSSTEREVKREKAKEKIKQIKQSLK